MRRNDIGHALRLILGLSGFVGLVWPAGAATHKCVGAADLGAGIRVDYKDGSAGEYRRLSDGLIELVEAGSAENGGNLRFISRFGVYDVEAAALVDGVASPDQSVSYTYAGTDLREPQAGSDPWVGEVTATFPTGETAAETAAYVFGPDIKVVFGDCSYAAVPVRATFVRANAWEGQEFLYFPALGIATLTGKSGRGLETTAFSLVDLRPLSP